MDDLTITIERRLNGQLLRYKTNISSSVVDTNGIDSIDAVEYAFRTLLRQFSHEYEMERENLKYAPKPMYNTRGGI